MDLESPPDPDRDRIRALDTTFAATPRRRRRRMHLTVRDVGVLELLIARRVETLDALHQLAFPAVSRKRAVNRLGELVSGGYLDRRSVVLPGADAPRSVYFLTPRGRAALQLRAGVGASWFATREWKLDLSEPSIPHQIVTNRVCDWLGAHAMPEHLLPPSTRRIAGKPASRPDAIYQAREPDDHGRQLVWLEVDLGHYNRKRILEKVGAGIRDEASRFLLIACATAGRRAWAQEIIRDAYGPDVWDRVGVMTFDELRAGQEPGWPSYETGLLPTQEIPTMLYEL